MSVQVQVRRGSTSAIGSITPAEGELIVDTAQNRLLVGDGATAGGWPLAKLNEAGAALGANGSALKLNVVETLVNALSGASVTVTNFIPAGALVVACAARVATTVSGAASFSVGYTGATSAFGSGLSTAAGSTNMGLIGPNPFYAPTNVVLTAAGGNFTAGAVRLALMYLSVTPPSA